MKRVYNSLVAVFILCIGTLFHGCGASYSLSGGSIPDWMRTVEVQFFENLAPMVYPTLSQNFTEGLKEYIRNNTRLSQVASDGDAVFEGTITNYTITPAAVEAHTDRAALNRLSITVRVKYTNTRDEEASYEESFTQFKEFAGNIQSQEENLNNEIIKMLTEEVYNKAFANW